MNVALRQTAPDRVPPQPDALRRDFVPIDQAAVALGKTPGQMARLCREDLSGRGLACKGRLDGGNEQWFVARALDRRLQGDMTRHQVALDALAEFTQNQRTAAHAKADCVERFRHNLTQAPGKVQDWLPGLLIDLAERHPVLAGRISRGVLYKWARLYQGPADLRKLVDQRGGNTRGQADPAAWRHFTQLFLDARQPSIRSCWERTRDYAKQEGLRWVSYQACARDLDRRISPAEQARVRDPVLWRQRYKAFIEQNPEAFEAGECSVGDHTQLDLVCRFGRQLIRPWLTAWLDWRTRKIVGWSLAVTPSSSTILAALRMALKDPSNLTLPGHVWIDNGKDFDAWFFHGQTKKQRLKRLTLKINESDHLGIFKMLGIETHFSLAYNPNGKAKLERWFGTLHDRFDRTFETYCGRNPSHKPEGLEAILKAGRLIPSFEHVRSRLKDFIAGYNINAEHSKDDLDGMSPQQALDAWCKTNRTLADPSVLDKLLVHWQEPVPVGRNGVKIRPLGKVYSYGAHAIELSPFKRARGRRDEVPLVRVSYDPDDLSSVCVYDLEWRFLCRAGLNRMGGVHDGSPISREALAAEIKRTRKLDKAQKTLRKSGMRQLLSTEENLAITAREHQREHGPTTAGQGVGPDRLKIVRTPLDGQSSELQDRRLAAGAESSSGEQEPGQGGLASLLAAGRAIGPSVDDPLDLPEPSDGDIWQMLKDGLRDHDSGSSHQADDDFEINLPWPPKREEDDDLELDLMFERGSSSNNAPDLYDQLASAKRDQTTDDAAASSPEPEGQP